jgi:hypothetical protein
MVDLERIISAIEELESAEVAEQLVGLEEAGFIFELIENQRVLVRLAERHMVPGQSVLLLRLFQRRSVEKCVFEKLFLRARQKEVPIFNIHKRMLDLVGDTEDDNKSEGREVFWLGELVYEVTIGRQGEKWQDTPPWQIVGMCVEEWAKEALRGCDYKIFDEEGRKKIRVTRVIETAEVLAKIVDSSQVLAKLLKDLGVGEG